MEKRAEMFWRNISGPVTTTALRALPKLNNVKHGE